NGEYPSTRHGACPNQAKLDPPLVRGAASPLLVGPSSPRATSPGGCRARSPQIQARPFGTAVLNVGGSVGVPSSCSSLKAKTPIRSSLHLGWGRTAARRIGPTAGAGPSGGGATPAA